MSKLTWLKRTNGHDFTPTEFRVLVAVFNHTDADARMYTIFPTDNPTTTFVD